MLIVSTLSLLLIVGLLYVKIINVGDISMILYAQDISNKSNDTSSLVDVRLHKLVYFM